jgi:hypothetical protein
MRVESRRYRSVTTAIFCLASLAVALQSHDALAQKKGKGGAKPKGPSAEETWTDPIEKEQSDKGPYAPQSPKDEAPKPEPEKPKPQDPGRTRDKLSAFAQLLIGFGSAPLNTPDNAYTGKGTALGIMLGGRYDVMPQLSVGLRVPVTTASVRQTDGKNLSSTAWGSPELLGEYRVKLNKFSSIPIGLGIGIPVAQGNPDLTNTADTEGAIKRTVNQLADATSGWLDSELFQPKRMPLVLSGGFHHERRAWEVHADAKFVMLPALNTDVANTIPAEVLPGTGEYVANSFALREVTVLGGSVNFFDAPLFYGGLDLALVWTPIETFEFEPTSETNKPSALQAVLEPKLGVRFKYLTPSVAYVAPLGGRLGSGDVGGVRLKLEFHL